MFKFVSVCCALLAVAAAAPGFVEEHHHPAHQVHVVQPVVAKVGAVVHSAPSAVSHQSFTQVHSKAHVVTPIVKTVPVHTTYAAAVPVVKSELVAAPAAAVHTTYTAPAVHHTYHHVAPLVKTVHAAPIVQTVHAAPIVPVVSHAVSHQSHVQIHQKKAVITPVVHAAVPVVHTVHTAPLLKTVVAATPVHHHYHH